MGPQRDFSANTNLVDQAIQDRLDGATRTSDVYKRIAQALAEAGYERSWKQCKD